MFICHKCLEERNITERDYFSILQSKGPCECCETFTICEDIPTKILADLVLKKNLQRNL